MFAAKAARLDNEVRLGKDEEQKLRNSASCDSVADNLHVHRYVIPAFIESVLKASINCRECQSVGKHGEVERNRAKQPGQLSANHRESLRHFRQDKTRLPVRGGDTVQHFTDDPERLLSTIRHLDESHRRVLSSAAKTRQAVEPRRFPSQSRRKKSKVTSRKLTQFYVLQVFEKAIEQSQLSLLQDWVVFSLANFTQSLPLGMSTWCLTCFFISASTNKWLRSMFPYVQLRIGRYEYEDRKMLCITSSDFYNNLVTEHQKQTFVDTFNKVKDQIDTPFNDLLSSI